jgi:hypothetical protein
MPTIARTLKKIAVADLRLGMHLHGFDAAWIDHPCWRSRFTLESLADLALVRGSKVRACWMTPPRAKTRRRRPRRQWPQRPHRGRAGAAHGFRQRAGARWDAGESIARMATWKGQFDGPVFAPFVRSVGIYPIGSLVRLASGRPAVVVDQNTETLTTPIVKVMFSTKSNLPIAVETIELAHSSDRITGRESRAAGTCRTSRSFGPVTR